MSELNQKSSYEEQANLFRPAFDALSRLRHVGDNPSVDPAAVSHGFTTLIESLMEKARASDFTEVDVQDICYAIVALADEIVLSKKGKLQQYWMAHLLQVRFFDENIAGQNFFSRLDMIRGDRSRLHVLGVYYVCLLLGFQGRYRVRGGELELADIRDELRSELIPRGEEESPLAPQASPPDGHRQASRSFPIIALSALFALASVAYYATIRWEIEDKVQDIYCEIIEFNTAEFNHREDKQRRDRECRLRRKSNNSSSTTIQADSSDRK